MGFIVERAELSKESDLGSAIATGDTPFSPFDQFRIHAHSFCYATLACPSLTLSSPLLVASDTFVRVIHGVSFLALF